VGPPSIVTTALRVRGIGTEMGAASVGME